MLSRLWIAFLISLSGLLTIAWLVALMHEKDFHPFRTLWSKFNKLPWAKQLAAILAAGFLWAYASVKPDGGGNGGGAGGNCGGVVGYVGHYWQDPITVYKHQGGAAGRGSVGGAGGDGIGIIYW